MIETSDLGLLERDVVMVPRGGRELIVASGADRIRFLHGLLTGDVAGTAEGGGCHSALLTPKGHVVADMRLFVRRDTVHIVVDAGQAEPTAAALARYAIMDDFQAAREPDFSVIAVLGPAAAARLGGAGLAEAAALAARPPLAHVEPRGDDGVWLARVHELGADGFWVAGSVAAVKARMLALEDAGVPHLAHTAAEAARIAALEPRWGAEITPDYFPMEVGLGDAIDYKKGCYLGQEPVVRIRDRGHINWRLCGLDVDSDGPGDPAPGDALESDVKPRAGRITSAGQLPGGRSVALALVHTSVPVGAAVRVKHGEAIISATVRAEA
jgi:folate-binding protein YgfZ